MTGASNASSMLPRLCIRLRKSLGTMVISLNMPAAQQAGQSLNIAEWSQALEPLGPVHPRVGPKNAGRTFAKAEGAAGLEGFQRLCSDVGRVQDFVDMHFAQLCSASSRTSGGPANKPSLHLYLGLIANPGGSLPQQAQLLSFHQLAPCPGSSIDQSTLLY